MSLREKIQQEKAVRAETRTAEQIQSQEQQAAATKQEFQGLVEKENSVAALQTRAQSATEQISQAKGNLKKERGVLRELHHESIDEVSGEAILPAQPAEFLRNDDLKGEEEVQSYAQAREAFRDSAKSAKEVAADRIAFLKSAGVENAETLSSDQVESLLEAQAAAAKGETEKFLLEHPEVNPERAAEVRERILAEKVDKLYLGSAANSRFQYQLYNGQLQNLTFRASLEKAISSDNGLLFDRSRYLDKIRNELGGSSENISELDVEALSLALAKQLLEGDPGWNRTIQNGFAKEFPGSLDGLSEEDKFAAAEKIVAELPETRQAASELLENYKDLVRYEQMPERIRELEKRDSELEGRLNRGSFDSRSVSEELRALDVLDADRMHKERSNQRQVETLTTAAARLIAVKQLPEVILDSPVEVTPGSYGLKIFVNIEAKVDHGEEINKLHSFNEKAGQEVPYLRDTIQRISQMKDGIFGASREKKEARAALFSRVKGLTGQEVATEQEAAGALDAAYQQTLANKAKIESLVQDEKEARERIRPLEELGDLLGEYRFKGTVLEYIDMLSAKIPEGMAAAETEQEKLRTEKEETAEKRRALEEERTALQEEKSELAKTIKDTKDSQERLQHELYTKKIISQRSAPRY